MITENRKRLHEAVIGLKVAPITRKAAAAENAFGVLSTLLMEIDLELTAIKKRMEELSNGK